MDDQHKTKSQLIAELALLRQETARLEAANHQLRQAASERDHPLERERAARAEAETARQQLSHILERVSDSFVALDTNWCYTYVNDKAAQTFGRRPDELIGKHIWTEFPEGIGLPFYQAYYRAVETQQPIFLEEYYPPYDRWFENRIYPSQDGLSVFFHDITEHKKIELQLQASEEQLKRIIETVPNSIVIVERDGQITFANSAAERTLGLTRRQLTERIYNDPDWKITALDGGPFPEEQLPFARVMQSGSSVYGVEHAIEYADGARVLLSINAVPLRDTSGELAGMVASLTDMTDRKRTEEQLHYQANLIANVSDAVIATDMQFNIQLWNSAAEKLYDWGESDVIHRPLSDFIQNEYTSDTREGTIRAVIERGFWKGEVTQNRRDGTRIPIQSTVSLVKDVQDRPIGFVAINRDITQRKQAEEALRESEEKFSQIFYASPIAISITRLADGRFMDVNESFLTRMGYARAEVIGRTALEIGMWANPGEREKMMRTLRADGSLRNFETEFRTKSGEVGTALLSREIVELGGEKYIIGSTLDITERKRAEEAVHESEARFSTIFQASPIGVNLFNLTDNRSMDVNDAFLKLIGYSREEVIGHSAGELNLFVDADVRTAWIQTLRSGGTVRGVDAKLRKKSGEIRDALASIDVIEIGGERMGLVITSDITERRRAEEALEASEERLRLSTELGGVAVWEYDFVSNTMSRSRNHDLLYGLDWQTKWDINTFLNATHPDDREHSNQVIQQAVAVGGPNEYTLDFRAVLSDQTIRWLNATGQVVERNSKGEGIIVRGCLIDITQRKQAEEALQRNERILRLFVEHAPAAIAMFDRDMNYVAASQRYRLDYELGGQNILGRSHYAVFPEIPAHWKEIHRHCLAGATEKAEEDPFPRLSGKLDWIRWEICPWYEANGAIGGIILFSEVITERKQAKEALRESEERYRVLFQHSPIGIVQFDRNLRVTDCNERFVQILQTSREKVVGLDIHRLRDQGGLPAFQKALTGEEGFAEDLYQATTSDTRVWLTTRTAPLFNPAGDVRGGVAIIEDITERKRAEEKLRLSNERFFNAFHTSPAGLTITRIADGKFIDVNEAFLGMFEFTREEVIGRTSTELNILSLEERTKLIQAQIESGGLRHAELISRSKSGKLIHLLFSSKPMELEGEAHHITTMIDITKRKHAEAELRESQRNLRALIENTDGYILAAGQDYRLLVANDKFLEDASHQFDHPVQIGDALIDDSTISSESHRQRKERYDRALKGEKFTVELELRSEAGSQWRQYWFSPIVSVADDIVGFTAFARDITERKHAEEDMRLSRDRLAELSRQLVQTHETESRAIGRELHDQIGQMLTALKLILGIASQLPPDMAAQKLTQAEELVDDLLTRVSALSLELRPPMLDDLGLLPALLWHVNRYQEQSGLQVEFKHSGVENQRFDPRIETTAYRIVQESLTNVARHAQAMRVRLEVRARDEGLDIQIEDDGQGFDPQTALAQHRGLNGLRERAQLVGGAFRLESEFGQGTRLFIQLPLKEDQV